MPLDESVGKDLTYPLEQNIPSLSPYQHGDYTSSSSDAESVKEPTDKFGIDEILESAVPGFISEEEEDEEDENVDDEEKTNGPDKLQPETGDGLRMDTGLSPGTSDVEDSDKESTTSGEYDTASPSVLTHEYFQIDPKSVNQSLAPIIEDTEQNNNNEIQTGSDLENSKENKPVPLEEDIVKETLRPTEKAFLPSFEDLEHDQQKSEDEAEQKQLPVHTDATPDSASKSSDSNISTDEAESSGDGSDEDTSLPERNGQGQTVLERLPTATGNLLLDVISTEGQHSSCDEDYEDDEEDDVFLEEKRKASIQQDSEDDEENDYIELSHKDSVVGSDYELLLSTGSLSCEPEKKEKKSSSSSDDDDDYTDLVKEVVTGPSPTKAIAYSEFLQQAKKMLEEDESHEDTQSESDIKNDVQKTDGNTSPPALSPREDWQSFTLSLEAKHKLGVVQITRKEEVVVYEQVLEWREPRRSSDIVLPNQADIPKLRDEENDKIPDFQKDETPEEEKKSEFVEDTFVHPVSPRRTLQDLSSSDDESIQYAEILPSSLQPRKSLNIALFSKGQEDESEGQSKDSGDGSSSDESVKVEQGNIDSIALQFTEKQRIKSQSSSESDGSKLDRSDEDEDDDYDDHEHDHSGEELEEEAISPSNDFTVEASLPREARQTQDSSSTDEREEPGSPHSDLKPADLFLSEIVIPVEGAPLEKSFVFHLRDHEYGIDEQEPEDSDLDISDSQESSISLAERVVVIDLGSDLEHLSPTLHHSDDDTTAEECSLGVVSVADMLYQTVELSIPNPKIDHSEDTEDDEDWEDIPRYTTSVELPSPSSEEYFLPIEMTPSKVQSIHSYLEWTKPREPLHSPVSSESKSFTESDPEQALDECVSTSDQLDTESEKEPVMLEEFLSLRREEYTYSLAPKVMQSVDLEIDVHDVMSDDDHSKDTDTDPTEMFVSAVDTPVKEISVEGEQSSSSNGSSSPVMLELKMPSSHPDPDNPKTNFITVKVRVQAPKPRSVQVFFEDPQKQREVFAVHQEKQRGKKNQPRSSGTQISMDDSDMPDSLLECSVASDVSFPSFAANGDVHFASTPDEENAPLGASFILDITDPQESLDDSRKSDEDVEDLKSESPRPPSEILMESVTYVGVPTDQQKPASANLKCLLQGFDDVIHFNQVELVDSDGSDMMDREDINDTIVETFEASTVIPAESTFNLDNFDKDPVFQDTRDTTDEHLPVEDHIPSTKLQPAEHQPLYFVGSDEVPVQLLPPPDSNSSPEKMDMADLLKDFEDDLQFRKDEADTRSSDDEALQLPPPLIEGVQSTVIELPLLAAINMEDWDKTADLMCPAPELSGKVQEDTVYRNVVSTDDQSPTKVPLDDLLLHYDEDVRFSAGPDNLTDTDSAPIESTQDIKSLVDESPLQAFTVQIELDTFDLQKLSEQQSKLPRESLIKEEEETVHMAVVFTDDQSPTRIPLDDLLQHYDEDVRFSAGPDNLTDNDSAPLESTQDIKSLVDESPLQAFTVQIELDTFDLQKLSDQQSKLSSESLIKEEEEIVIVPSSVDTEEGAPERVSLEELLQDYDDDIHFDTVSEDDEKETEVLEPILSGSKIVIEESQFQCCFIDTKEQHSQNTEDSNLQDVEENSDDGFYATHTVTTESEKETVTMSSKISSVSSTPFQFSRETYSETVTSEWSYSAHETRSRNFVLELDEDDLDDLDESGGAQERYPSFVTPTKPESDFSFEEQISSMSRDFPYFAEELCDLVVDVGDMAILQCHVNGEPSPDVTWYKDGQPVRANENVTFQILSFKDKYVELVINPARLEDEGQYTAEVMNIHGSTTSSAYLTVRASENSEDEEDTAVAAGDSSAESATSGSDEFHTMGEETDKSSPQCQESQASLTPAEPLDGSSPQMEDTISLTSSQLPLSKADSAPQSDQQSKLPRESLIKEEEETVHMAVVSTDDQSPTRVPLDDLLQQYDDDVCFSTGSDNLTDTDSAPLESTQDIKSLVDESPLQAFTVQIELDTFDLPKLSDQQSKLPGESLIKEEEETVHMAVVFTDDQSPTRIPLDDLLLQYDDDVCFSTGSDNLTDTDSAPLESTQDIQSLVDESPLQAFTVQIELDTFDLQKLSDQQSKLPGESLIKEEEETPETSCPSPHSDLKQADLFLSEVVIPIEVAPLKKRVCHVRDHEYGIDEGEPEEGDLDISEESSISLAERVVVIDLGSDLEHLSPTLHHSDDDTTAEECSLGVVSVADKLYQTVELSNPNPKSDHSEDTDDDEDWEDIPRYTTSMELPSPSNEEYVLPIEVTPSKVQSIHSYLECIEPREPLHSPVPSESKSFTESDLEQVLDECVSTSDQLDTESEKKPVMLEEFLSLRREEYTFSMAPKVMQSVDLEINVHDVMSDDDHSKDTATEKETDESDNEENNQAAPEYKESDPTEMFVSAVDIPVEEISVLGEQSSSSSGSSSPVMLELKMPSSHPDPDNPETNFVKVRVQESQESLTPAEPLDESSPKMEDTISLTPSQSLVTMSKPDSAPQSQLITETPETSCPGALENNPKQDLKQESSSIGGNIFDSQPDGDDAPLHAADDLVDSVLLDRSQESLTPAKPLDESSPKMEDTISLTASQLPVTMSKPDSDGDDAPVHAGDALVDSVLLDRSQESLTPAKPLDGSSPKMEDTISLTPSQLPFTMSKPDSAPQSQLFTETPETSCPGALEDNPKQDLTQESSSKGGNSFDSQPDGDDAPVHAADDLVDSVLLDRSQESLTPAKPLDESSPKMEDTISLTASQLPVTMSKPDSDGDDAPLHAADDFVESVLLDKSSPQSQESQESLTPAKPLDESSPKMEDTISLTPSQLPDTMSKPDSAPQSQLFTETPETSCPGALEDNPKQDLKQESSSAGGNVFDSLPDGDDAPLHAADDFVDSVLLDKSSPQSQESRESLTPAKPLDESSPKMEDTISLAPSQIPSTMSKPDSAPQSQLITDTPETSCPGALVDNPKQDLKQESSSAGRSVFDSQPDGDDAPLHAVEDLVDSVLLDKSSPQIQESQESLTPSETSLPKMEDTISLTPSQIPSTMSMPDSAPKSQLITETPETSCPGDLVDNPKQDLKQESSSIGGNVFDSQSDGDDAPLHAVDDLVDSVLPEEQELHECLSKGLICGSFMF